MKVRNETNETGFDPSGVLAPQLFYGPGAPNTERRFTDAPVLSEYWDVTNGIKYAKLANNRLALDWQPVLIASAHITGDVYLVGSLEVTGDTLVGGTLTAGDVVAAT